MSCVLKLNTLLFDKLFFKRVGKHDDSEFEFQISITIGTNATKKDVKRVSVEIKGSKDKEYELEIQATGIFEYVGEAEDAMIQQNAVAIIMPYVRSQVTLLTSQPGVEPIVLPPFNVVEMMK